ncbi:polysaccharide lyase family 14 protein [Favolaschia claudopus]|uniref:Polysaccharide lyase family 14 protein n=1 Tax=Favolaschia claudopus TaxID=2862362 RepID=A0AAW0CIX4_9AGAR
MHASQFYILFIAFLATAVSADFHDNHWSRHAHKAVARSKQVEAPIDSNPTKRLNRRRSCKPPSSFNSSSLDSEESGSTVVAQSTTKSAASTASATSEKPRSSAKSPSNGKPTSSSAESKPTGSSSSGSGGGSGGGGQALSLKALFPEGTPDKSWTTSPKSSSALSLSDSTFKPTNLLKNLLHTYMSAPDGKEAMRATYPKGSYTFTHSPQGGLSFYAPGPNSLDMTTAKTLTFGYSVFFEKGFDFNMGGKLPGLYGGNDPETSIGCSGGRRSTECYSVRLMWRTDGMGEIYSYLPNYEVEGFAANKKVCDVQPMSECNPTYGASVGRGSFTFPAGEWTTVSQRVKLNDVGKANGEMQLWVNGESVIDVSGLILRDSAAGRHRGIQMQTFFGGSHPEWASPKTQSAYFSDFSVAILESL